MAAEAAIFVRNVASPLSKLINKQHTPLLVTELEVAKQVAS